MGRGEVYTGFWWGNLSERGHLEDPGLDGIIVLIWLFKKWDVEGRTGWIWLKMWTSGGHL
jgi:hypothetical protein